MKTRLFQSAAFVLLVACLGLGSINGRAGDRDAYDDCGLVEACTVCDDACDQECRYLQYGDSGIGRFACDEETFRPSEHRDACDTGVVDW